MVDGNNKTLRMLNLTINTEANCDLFNSCKKVKYVTQVSAMGNAIGFTTFQVFKIFIIANKGTEAYRKSQIIMFTKYSQKNGMIFKNDQCDLKIPLSNRTRYGFEDLGNCTCNS